MDWLQWEGGEGTASLADLPPCFLLLTQLWTGVAVGVGCGLLEQCAPGSRPWTCTNWHGAGVVEGERGEFAAGAEGGGSWSLL